MGEEGEFKELYERYKIVPEKYRGKIGTRLKGTFYSNEKGKVYYEPDKPMTLEKESRPLMCSAIPEPDYTFEHEIGKIVKYHGNAEHLVIPDYFLVDGQCWPVRIIGEAAFMQGVFKSIVIPGTVITIEKDAFKDKKLPNIYIPGSVSTIQPGAFDGNYEVIYGGSSSQVNGGGGGGSYTHVNGGGSSSIIHRTPSAGQAGVIFHPSSGTIVKSSGGSGGGGGGGGGYIPPYINVNGKDVPVKKVAKGAYQGLGLITVILPETLEIIEDYAFAGNQLIGITIPNGVKHIGHYAFAFNEIWKEGDIAGPDRKATIKTIIIKEDEQFNKVDKYGDIYENGIKTNIIKGNDKGPDVVLKNHIWVTSIGNHVIDEKYIEGENKVEIVIPGPKPETGGQAYASDGEYTFLGEVLAKDFITGAKLTELTGITQGNAMNSDKDNNAWLKFTKAILDEDGKRTGEIKTLFIAKKPIRSYTSWGHLNDQKVVYGDDNGKKITIGENEYIVRLPRGANPAFNPKEPITQQRNLGIAVGNGYSAGPIHHGSEWNRMMLPIHVDASEDGWKGKFSEALSADENKTVFDHTLGTGKGRYTNADLGVGTRNGGYSWMQERPRAKTRMIRGDYGLDSSDDYHPNGLYAHYGWRPVLEFSN